MNGGDWNADRDSSIAVYNYFFIGNGEKYFVK